MNYDLEYQKSEVNSQFMYNSADQREKMVLAERKWVDDRTNMILDLKNKVCKPGETFVIINQKGIDPLALDMLAREGILALRRAKKRNMERVVLACGGESINSLDMLSDVKILGYAEHVEEQALDEETYTFIEGVQNPFSCTVLVKGAHKHVLEQIKDAVRDGLRAVSNAMTDGFLVQGAGAFEIMAHAALLEYKAKVTGRAKLGVQAYADALLVIPKTLAANAGYDAQDSIIKLQEAHAAQRLRHPLGRAHGPRRRRRVGQLPRQAPDARLGGGHRIAAAPRRRGHPRGQADEEGLGYVVRLWRGCACGFTAAHQVGVGW